MEAEAREPARRAGLRPAGRPYALLEQRVDGLAALGTILIGR